MAIDRDTAVLICCPVRGCAVEPAANSFKMPCGLCGTIVWVSPNSLSQIIQESPRNHAIVCIPCSRTKMKVGPDTTIMAPNQAVMGELEQHGITRDQLARLMRRIFPHAT